MIKKTIPAAAILLYFTGFLFPLDGFSQSCNVNLLIAYTSGAADSLKGKQAAVQQIIEAAHGLNTSYIYSGVTHQVVLVRTVYLGDVETGCFASDLNDFQSSSYISTLRDKYHADIAAVIFRSDEFCGLPYLDNQVADASTAYCAVNYQCMISNFSLSHQVAHLYGCAHFAEENFAADSVPYKYGHGYKWAFSEDKNASSFSTIMGIGDDDFCAGDSGEICNLIPYFSNPRLQYMGVQLGVTGISDNASVLNMNSGLLAAFEPLPANQTDLSDTVNYHNLAIATAMDTLATGQYYNITDSAVVNFRAGKCIVLNAGFIAGDGVRFETFIDPGVTDCKNLQGKLK